VQTRRGDLESLQSLTDLYRHYVQSEIIFDDRRTRALHDGLPQEAPADIGFDVTDIDWEDYFQTVHFPSITAMTRAFSVRPAAAGAVLDTRALPQRTDVVAVFDLEGTVLDSNIVEQYLWVRSNGFRKAAWPAEVASLLTGLPAYLRAEGRDRGEFIRAFLRRYAGMPVSRLKGVVRSAGYAGTPCPRRSRASRSTAPPGTAPFSSRARSAPSPPPSRTSSTRSSRAPCTSATES
jgi:fatty acyl-CoA reductase